jgi:hypothetical protein
MKILFFLADERAREWKTCWTTRGEGSIVHRSDVCGQQLPGLKDDWLPLGPHRERGVRSTTVLGGCSCAVAHRAEEFGGRGKGGTRWGVKSGGYMRA